MSNNKYATNREFQMLRDEVGVLFKKVDTIMNNDIPHIQQTLTSIEGKIDNIGDDFTFHKRLIYLIGATVLLMLLGLTTPQIIETLGGII